MATNPSKCHGALVELVDRCRLCGRERRQFKDGAGLEALKDMHERRQTVMAHCTECEMETVHDLCGWRRSDGE